MKTIGVLGGLGPQATMEFEACLHRSAQELVAQQANSGYPPLVVFYYRHVPFAVSAAGKPELPLRPAGLLLDAASKLGGLVDFIVMTSNFLHLFRAEIEEASGREVLSMIDLVLAELRDRGWRRVGVVGFGDPVVYTQPLAALGLSTETISRNTQTQLDAAIHQLMEGREDDASARSARAAIDELRARQVDGIILGCTEITLLLPQPGNARDLIDPLQLLAEAAVLRAIN